MRTTILDMVRGLVREFFDVLHEGGVVRVRPRHGWRLGRLVHMGEMPPSATGLGSANTGEGMGRKVSAWLGVVASGISLLAFFGIKNVDQLQHVLTGGLAAGPITNNTPSGLCLDTNTTPAAGVSLVLNPCGNDAGQNWQR